MAALRPAVVVAALLAALFSASVRGESPSEHSSTSRIDNPERTPAQLRAAVRAALKAAAAAKDADRERAARALLSLYEEIGKDTSLSAAERANLSAAARDRLARIGKQLRNQLTREKKLARADKPTATEQSAAKHERKNADLLSVVQQFPVAAQQFPFAAQQAAAGRPNANQPRPFQQPLFGPMASPPVADHGQELVELIEATIAPDSWASRGGPASIVYFRPSLALIVNQSAEVHDQLGGLLGQLRK